MRYRLGQRRKDMSYGYHYCYYYSIITITIITVTIIAVITMITMRLHSCDEVTTALEQLEARLLSSFYAGERGPRGFELAITSIS